MRINELTAYIFSVALQPLLMPVYNVILLFAYTSFFDVYSGQALRILMPVILFTFIIPSIFLLLLKKLKMIGNYALTDRRERTLPYLMTGFSNAMLIYYFFSANIYIWFLGLIAAPFFIILFALIINMFWKISAHMLGIGGLIGCAMSICFNVKELNPFILFIILFILAGCLGVSQLYLKRNTPAQLYTGFIAGFIIAFISVWSSIYYMLYIK